MRILADGSLDGWKSSSEHLYTNELRDLQVCLQFVRVYTCVQFTFRSDLVTDEHVKGVPL
jgi:hypothetical protein